MQSITGQICVNTHITVRTAPNCRRFHEYIKHTFSQTPLSLQIVYTSMLLKWKVCHKLKKWVKMLKVHGINMFFH